MTESYVADDYPGKVTYSPSDTDELVLSIFGFQSKDGEAASDAWTTAKDLIADGATHVEHARRVDAQGHENRLLLGYWLGEEAYLSWWRRADVQGWWTTLPGHSDSNLGAWREVMTTPFDRHQYASGQDDPAGPSAFLPLKPSDKFGFQGAYRARLPASAHDDFKSPLDAVPRRLLTETRGRRLTVEVPDNVCFIREGQTWDTCSSEEITIWREKMEPVIDGWIKALESDEGTGCITIRDAREMDSHGSMVDRRSQFAFLLSLGHIEEAARTNPAHLELMNTFTNMYATLPFPPRMNIWVEVHIPAPGKIQAEYINCHSDTGFLPYFPATESRSDT